MVLDLDLNDPPPVENVLLMSNPISINPNWAQGPELGLSLAQAATDIEHVDDEVVICSPRSFAEAREKSRRNRELIEVLEETESLRARSVRLSSRGNRRRRAPLKQMTSNNNLCINLERLETTVNEHVAVPQQLPQPVPQPRAPAFSCPVCMGPFVEETSTKCGHIFCKKCVSAAITAQSKCPTCRRKLKIKDVFRIYLPTSE